MTSIKRVRDDKDWNLPIVGIVRPSASRCSPWLTF